MFRLGMRSRCHVRDVNAQTSLRFLTAVSCRYNNTAAGRPLLPTSPIHNRRLYSDMSPTKEEHHAAESKGSKKEDLEGEHNEWKFKAPYKVHEGKAGFDAKYEGSCHCGRVKYQLSREKPLAAKYCHCTTCQVIHGVSARPFVGTVRAELISGRCTFPVGCHLREGRHQLHPRPSRPGLVRQRRQDDGAQAPLQSQLRLLQESHHGRGPQHDPAVPHPAQVQGQGGEGEVRPHVSVDSIPPRPGSC